jgi:hypothetical protein
MPMVETVAATEETPEHVAEVLDQELMEMNISKMDYEVHEDEDEF